jgi:hypothetical protein
MIRMAAVVVSFALVAGVAFADTRLNASEARKFVALQHKLERTVNQQLGLATKPAPSTKGKGAFSALVTQMIRTDQAMLRSMLRPRAVSVRLRPGDSTVEAYRQAKRSKVPTVIEMDFGGLFVSPGEKPRFEVTGGTHKNDPGNSVRRAHNLAFEIGPVVVTRKGAVIGTATRESASEKPLLKALGVKLR